MSNELAVVSGHVYLMVPRPASAAGPGGVPPVVAAGGYNVFDISDTNRANVLASTNPGQELILAGAGGGSLQITTGGNTIPSINGRSQNNTVTSVTHELERRRDTLPAFRVSGGTLTTLVTDGELMNLSAAQGGGYVAAPREHNIVHSNADGSERVTFSGRQPNGLSSARGLIVDVANDATLVVANRYRTSPTATTSTIPVTVIPAPSPDNREPAPVVKNSEQVLRIRGGAANHERNLNQSRAASWTATNNVARALTPNTPVPANVGARAHYLRLQEEAGFPCPNPAQMPVRIVPPTIRVSTDTSPIAKAVSELDLGVMENVLAAVDCKATGMAHADNSLKSPKAIGVGDLSSGNVLG